MSRNAIVCGNQQFVTLVECAIRIICWLRMRRRHRLSDLVHSMRGRVPVPTITHLGDRLTIVTQLLGVDCLKEWAPELVHSFCCCFAPCKSGQDITSRRTFDSSADGDTFTIMFTCTATHLCFCVAQCWTARWSVRHLAKMFITERYNRYDNRQREYLSATSIY